MAAMWEPDMNGSVQLRHVPVSSTQLYFWRATCGQHLRLMQVDSVQQALKKHRKHVAASAGASTSSATSGGNGGGSSSSNSGSCLRCPVCDPLSTEISRHVQPVHATADATGQHWVAEVQCAGGRCSGADLYFPRLKLAVMVDGAGHTHVQVHTKTLEQQQRTDAYFDNEVVRQGLRALRIHWRDESAAAAALAAAIRKCEEQPAAAFVMYSSSYKRPIKSTVDEEHWEEVGKRRQPSQQQRIRPARCAPCTDGAGRWCQSQT